MTQSELSPIRTRETAQHPLPDMPGPDHQDGLSKPSTSTSASASSSALPSKLAKNKKLPATMITSQGSIAPSKRNAPTNTKRKGGAGGMSKKKRKRNEEGKERAVEREGKLEEKVRSREDRKVSSGGLFDVSCFLIH